MQSDQDIYTVYEEVIILVGNLSELGILARDYYQSEAKTITKSGINRKPQNCGSYKNDWLNYWPLIGSLLNTRISALVDDSS